MFCLYRFSRFVFLFVCFASFQFFRGTGIENLPGSKLASPAATVRLSMHVKTRIARVVFAFVCSVYVCLVIVCGVCVERLGFVCVACWSCACLLFVAFAFLIVSAFLRLRLRLYPCLCLCLRLRLCLCLFVRVCVC